MAGGHKPQIVRQLRFVVAAWKEDGRSDVELLSRFCHWRDEQAFTTLVGRYSGLVWGACARVLGNTADAEDAFQATFLRLARDAKKILHRQTLPTWLYRVARCSAIDLRRVNAKQKRIEKRLYEAADLAGRTGDPAEHIRTILDDELEQLPERYRAVLILCNLEGRTYADASLDLGCSVAAVHRMAVKAQDMLRQRLLRRGCATTPAGLSVGVLLAASGGVSAAPARLLACCVEEGVKCAATGLLPATPAGALAAALPTAGGKIVSGAWSGTVLAGMAIALAATGWAAASRVPSAAKFAAVASPARPDPAAPLAALPEVAPEDGGATVIAGTARTTEGEPVPGAPVVALARVPFEPAGRGLRDEIVARGRTRPDGKFALRVPAGNPGWFTNRILTVRVAAGDRTPTTTSVRVQGGSRVELGELLVRPGAPLTARLIDDAGRPAPSVLVEVVRVGDVAAESVVGLEHRPDIPGWPAPTRTDADGRFGFAGLGDAENVWVRIADPRYAIDTLPVRSHGDLRVVTANSVEFAVTAADTGEPLPHARVAVLTEQLRSHPYFCVADAAILAAGTAPPEEFDFIADGNGRIRVGLAPGAPAEILVHPPEGRPLIGVRRTLLPGPAGGAEVHTLSLPAGRWVEGVVLDADSGSPVAGAIVHWGRADADRPEWRDEYLVGRDSYARTGPDGTFRIALLPGPRTLRVHGPSLNYLPVPLPLPGTKGTTLYAHAVEQIDVPDAEGGSPLRVRLRQGETRAGRVELDNNVGVVGKPAILSSGRVSPVRGYASLPLPVAGGRFELPGCEPGMISRAYLIDPLSRVGAVFDVPPLGVGDVPLVVRPEPCGAARLRVTDAAGRPVPGCEVVLSLLLARDRPSGSDPSAADPQPADWFDPVNYARRPVTDADGVADLTALIPGADYVASALTPNGRVRVGQFRAAPGAVLDLPVAVMPDRPAPGGDLSHRMRAR